MREKCIIAMVGHTAAGKTTLARFLSKRLVIPYVSEGEFKRSLKPQYTSENSLDEELRDKGYRMAIDHCIDLLFENDIVIIDASFHKLIRRLWLLDALNPLHRVNVIWLYCDCPDEKVVRERLHKRALEKDKNADNQADQFYIYKFIKSTFDPVVLDDFNPLIGTAVVKINTAQNIIIGVKKTANCNTLLLNTLVESILPNYLEAKQSLLLGGLYG